MYAQRLHWSNVCGFLQTQCHSHHRPRCLGAARRIRRGRRGCFLLVVPFSIHHLCLSPLRITDAFYSSFAMGVDYVSEQISLDGQRVKPYTIFDASWTTQWNAMLLSINVKNLFDKEYAVSGFSERNGHFPGEPREVVVQVSYDF